MLIQARAKSLRNHIRVAMPENPSAEGYYIIIVILFFVLVFQIDININEINFSFGNIVHD